MCKTTKIDNHIVIRLRRKIIIHPDINGDGQGHISVYLAIVGTSSLHADWEVNASFSFLIFDQIHDNYTVMRGMKRRFHNINTEWGFAKCVSHKTFKDPSNGYLVNDKCIFEVDLYVIKNQGVGECLSSSSGVKPYKHEWKINEITKLKNIVYSEKFTVKGYKWSTLDRFYLCERGSDSGQNGQCISIFIQLVDAEGFDRQKKVKAKFSISMQNKISGEDRKETGNDTLS
ncbi:putative non-functional NADPH-dependent codeinone reductase 2-like [Capsicum annuum]|nr:putative non-functional NADPH-dependent codeinone reductase 2-like [Capsicum annuum]KAF3649166.1 putative non-functional NADPH-dependent codeinone reductase 2-like [Capsicum annuum]